MSWPRNSMAASTSSRISAKAPGTIPAQLAIRQAVAAGTNITYKILYNDAVAMTGGQPVDGPVSVAGDRPDLPRRGRQRIALVSDDISENSTTRISRAGTTFHHARSGLDAVQRELARDPKGVTVLIYEQTCATEKRRRRKRGTMEDPQSAFVHQRAGLRGLRRLFGRVQLPERRAAAKRRWAASARSTCRPATRTIPASTASVPASSRSKAQTRRKKDGDGDGPERPLKAGLPAPETADTRRKPFDLLVTGVGGTGVVTVGALITMAAHLEGKGVRRCWTSRALRRNSAPS